LFFFFPDEPLKQLPASDGKKKVLFVACGFWSSHSNVGGNPRRL
jgi:hypothetical protein